MNRILCTLLVWISSACYLNAQSFVGPLLLPEQVDATTGVTISKLVIVAAASSNATIALTTTTTGNIGVATQTVAAGGGGFALLRMGPAFLVSDGDVTIGHYIINSTTTGGSGHDLGTGPASACPTGQVVGIWSETATGASAHRAWIDLDLCPAATGAGATTNQNYRTISVGFDGGGSAISANKTYCTQVNFGGTIDRFTMISDVTGTAKITVSSVVTGSYTGPGSASDISNGGEQMTAATKLQDGTLTSWSTTLAANSVVCFALSTPSGATWYAANLRVSAN